MTAHPAVWKFLAACITLSALTNTVYCAAEQYELVVLPLPDDDTIGYSYANDASNSEIIVGCLMPEVFVFYRAAVWEKVDGEWQVSLLPSMHEDPIDCAHRVTETGDIVGWAANADTGDFTAVRWSKVDGEWIVDDLGSLGGVESWCIDISASGIIVGESDPPGGGLDHPFIYQDGVMTDLMPTVAHDVAASGINNAGQVCIGGNPGVDSFLYLPEPAYGLDAGIVTLPNLGGSECFAASINDSGLMCGSARTPDGIFRGVVWQDFEITNVTPDADDHSFATHISHTGAVVGFESMAGELGAYMWEAGQKFILTDLVVGDAPWIVHRAYGINEAGWIAGNASLDGGPERACVLIPSCGEPSADLDGDGVVGPADLALLLGDWGIVNQ